MRATREDLVRWFDAGSAQGYDFMIATDDPAVTPLYWREEDEEDGPAFDDQVLRNYATRAKHLRCFNLHGHWDAQIEDFLKPLPPLRELSPEESTADIRRIFDEFQRVFDNYEANPPRPKP